MSIFQKLCDVYDSLIDTTATEGENPLTPIGFTREEIAFNIILSPEAEFVSVSFLPEKEKYTVPSTPLAEARSGSLPDPYPLADKLKYFITIGESSNPLYEKYIKQLREWCEQTHAPECLHVLLRYLEKKTLYADLKSNPSIKVNVALDENTKKLDGSDVDKIVCFSIEYPDDENRLWMRRDVRESWEKRFTVKFYGTPGLCYVTGQTLGIMEKHPGVSGTSRLISSKDDAFPFRYKGRFVENGSAATVSSLASFKAHKALNWLLKHQGFQRYGMSFVGWNTQAPALYPEEEEKPLPDTFGYYIHALFQAAQGYEKDYQTVTDPEEISERQRHRIHEVVLLGLQAATQGRISVIYEQEIPENVFVENVENWYKTCKWQMPHREGQSDERSPTWKQICEVVMGPVAFQEAKDKMDSSSAKQMRDLQMRLLACTVNKKPLPSSMVHSAFQRAIRPLTFPDDKSSSWDECVAFACALIRKHFLDRGLRELSFVLDPSCTDRCYLYGRLFAIANKLEYDATGETKTNAIRLMTRFVQRPDDTWLHLFQKLLPYLRKLGSDHRSARRYLRLLGEVEYLFSPDDLCRSQPLSELFLIGFSAQNRELWLKHDDRHQISKPLQGYQPSGKRDELYGCLLAIADRTEWMTESALIHGEEFRSSHRESTRDGRTNALLSAASFIANPCGTWTAIHDRMIPYLEKSGIKSALYTQRLLCRIEQSFSEEDRLSTSPLNRFFLHGYLTMTLALATPGGLDTDFWQPSVTAQIAPQSREAAYGALLALENDLERAVLDLNKDEEENRPSNAMRFMSHAAQMPGDVWLYLRERMRPYEKKSWFGEAICRRESMLWQLITGSHWNTNEPLKPDYLHYFYLYSNMQSMKKDERKDN